VLIDSPLQRPTFQSLIAEATFFLSALVALSSFADAIPQSVGQLGLPQALTPPAAAPNVLAVAGPQTPLNFSRDQPHPAVARIVVPEGNATSYGSGTLVDVRGNYGLVITNWHVVRDGHGEAEVIFPDGFRSPARPVKVDADWDLAALIIWRPRVAPVKIAANAPQPGDRLTICGYGSGRYRAVTGRCTQYYAPKLDLPQHMVELDVEARQGDSGGPIFNERGELAGVLFGAGHGTTLGSFGGRVGWFLATLAPGIGRATDLAVATMPPQNPQAKESVALTVAEPAKSTDQASSPRPSVSSEKTIDPKPSVDEKLAATSPATSKPPNDLANHGWHAVAAKTQPTSKTAATHQPVPITLNLPVSKILAAIGILALTAQLIRAAR
jgi:hypothetical protein